MPKRVVSSMFPKIFIQSISLVLIQWLVIKFVLNNEGVEGIGLYFLYISILSPVFMFFTGHFKNYGTQNLYGEWPTLVNIRLMQLAATSIFVAIAFVYFPSAIFLLVVALKLFEVGVDTKLAQETRSGRIHVTFLCIVVSLVLMVVATFYISKVEVLAIWFLTIFTVFILSVAVPQKKELGLNSVPARQSFLTILKSVGLQSAVVALVGTVPRLSLEHFAGLEALAVFGTMSYFVLLAHVITMSVFQSSISNENEALNLLKVKKKLSLLLIVGLLGLVISYFIHQPLIEIIFDESISQHSHWLPWFVGYIVIWALVSFLEQTAIQQGGSDYLVKLNLGILVIALITCPALIYFLEFNGVVVYMYALNTGKLVLLWLFLEKVNKRGQLAV